MSLFGLRNKVDIVRYADGDDGAGGIGPGAEIPVSSGELVRISRLDRDEDIQAEYGLDSGEYWQVVSNLNLQILNGDFVVITSSSNPPCPNGYYQVVWTRTYQDEHGCNHHTSCLIKFVSTVAPNA